MKRTLPIVEVRAATKYYEQRDVLAEISFDLYPGSWVGLLGRNGAGKTTLLQALAGLIDLDEGEVLIRGERRGIGLVPQEIALYPLLSVRQNLQTFGRIHRLRGEALRDRVAWAVDWAGLEERARDPVGTLSVGMQRRLNIACGVLHRPALVLLDEPTVGVDVEARLRIWSMLASLRDDGAALLQSNHEVGEIQANCDRVIVLDRGRLLADGSIADLVRTADPVPHALRLTLERSTQKLPLPPHFRFDGERVHGRVRNVAVELPELLRTLARAGHVVTDVHVERPDLGEVFARLTWAGERR